VQTVAICRPWRIQVPNFLLPKAGSVPAFGRIAFEFFFPGYREVSTGIQLPRAWIRDSEPAAMDSGSSSSSSSGPSTSSSSGSSSSSSEEESSSGGSSSFSSEESPESDYSPGTRRSSKESSGSSEEGDESRRRGKSRKGSKSTNARRGSRGSKSRKSGRKSTGGRGEESRSAKKGAKADAKLARAGRRRSERDSKKEPSDAAAALPGALSRTKAAGLAAELRKKREEAAIAQRQQELAEKAASTCRCRAGDLVLPLCLCCPVIFLCLCCVWAVWVEEVPSCLRCGGKEEEENKEEVTDKPKEEEGRKRGAVVPKPTKLQVHLCVGSVFGEEKWAKLKAFVESEAQQGVRPPSKTELRAIAADAAGLPQPSAGGTAGNQPGGESNTAPKAVGGAGSQNASPGTPEDSAEKPETPKDSARSPEKSAEGAKPPVSGASLRGSATGASRSPAAQCMSALDLAVKKLARAIADADKSVPLPKGDALYVTALEATHYAAGPSSEPGTPSETEDVKRRITLQADMYAFSESSVFFSSDGFSASAKPGDAPETSEAAHNEKATASQTAWTSALARSAAPDKTTKVADGNVGGSATEPVSDEGVRAAMDALACEIFKSAENPGEFTLDVLSAAGAGISEVTLALGGREYTQAVSQAKSVDGGCRGNCVAHWLRNVVASMAQKLGCSLACGLCGSVVVVGVVAIGWWTVSVMVENTTEMVWWISSVMVDFFSSLTSNTTENTHENTTRWVHPHSVTTLSRTLLFAAAALGEKRR